jgi:hypothetical protein
LQQAALLLDMSPNTIAYWRDTKKLGPAPWSAAELWAVKNRPGAPFRRRGITSKHGTRSRFNAGCRCDLCGTAGAAVAREHVREYERRQAEKSLPPAVRAELIERLRRGELFASAVQALGISPSQVWGRARSDPEWGAQLQSTLDQARPTDLRHGVQSSYNRGCRCTECRSAKQRASRVSVSHNLTGQKVGRSREPDQVERTGW